MKAVGDTASPPGTASIRGLDFFGLVADPVLDPIYSRYRKGARGPARYSVSLLSRYPTDVNVTRLGRAVFRSGWRILFQLWAAGKVVAPGNKFGPGGTGLSVDVANG